jgi:DNA-binding NarL/FixJ family response regulator
MAQTKKILLVDDSQIFLMGLRMAFQAADWVDGIFEARNSDQALKML